MADVLKLDLYGILGVSPDADEKQIVKAYRKKALKCHPDKNPDNPKAAEEFHELAKALEVLTDKAAKNAYDKVLKAKKANELRNRVLDSKRKKFKDDLEARERATLENEGRQKSSDLTAAEQLEAEILRLRREGSHFLEQEQERIRAELQKEKEAQNYASVSDDDSTCASGARLKLKWKSKKSDITNGGYSQEYLQKLLEKYGEVTAVVISSKKNGTAIVEFSSSHSAMQAVQNEVGIDTNPISFTWLSGDPAQESSPVNQTTTSFCDSQANKSKDSFYEEPVDPSNRDFESIVLMRLRQAEERKRLIAQAQAEDESEDKT